MTGRWPIYKKSIELGLSGGKAVMIGRLYAAHCGAARCYLDTVPEQRVAPIHDAFEFAGPARMIAAGEPTF